MYLYACSAVGLPADGVVAVEEVGIGAHVWRNVAGIEHGQTVVDEARQRVVVTAHLVQDLRYQIGRPANDECLNAQ